MTPCCRRALAVAILTLVTGTLHAAPPDPKGKPVGMEPGQPLRWYVWHSPDGWHVRTTTKIKEHHFHGTIHVVGGVINRVGSARLERKGSVRDWWKLSDGNRTLTLDLNTDGGMDGFDFEVGPNADEIEFSLKIDGDAEPDRIFIGRGENHPRKATFSLPAHP